MTTGGANAAGSGDLGIDRQLLDELFSAAYEELRHLAAAVRRSDHRATKTPTTLVNEAWLKLAASPRFSCFSHLHFKRIAARAMRQVLIEGARRRGAAKRSGAIIVTLDDSVEAPASTGDLLALDSALTDLARRYPRLAEIVEYKFFGGLEHAEIADVMGLSERTVRRDWRAAKAWLSAHLGRTG